jgi:hypothetical protein
VGNWRKSTYSDANGGDCIEVASSDIIMVRDTVDRDDTLLAGILPGVANVHGIPKVNFRIIRCTST